MPQVTEVIVNAPGTVIGQNSIVSVNATIRFTSKERQLALDHVVRIALYELDDQMDVYAIQPNWSQLFVQRAARGDKDDFNRFSDVIRVTADEAEKSVSFTFNLGTAQTPERDRMLEYKAMVICIPEIATAIAWSATAKSPHIVT